MLPYKRIGTTDGGSKLLQHRYKKAELLPLAEFDFDLSTCSRRLDQQDREQPVDMSEDRPEPSDAFAAELWGLATVLAELGYHGSLRPRPSAADIPDGAFEVAKAILGPTNNGE